MYSLLVYAALGLNQQVERIDAEAVNQDARRGAHLVLFGQGTPLRRLQRDARERDPLFLNWTLAI